jgi:adenine-specific DNA-methyltransferase
MFYVLLAAVIEGADRVANTAGVYAAYIKQWQPNALRPLGVIAQTPIPSRLRCVAHQADAAQVAEALGPVDLLYVDPPYNTRQYAGYYHVPELIARGWFDVTVSLRGKTGLIADEDQRSAWCSRREAPNALRELLTATGARHVLVSYNSEGVIPDKEMRSALADAAIDGRVRRFTRLYKLYLADSVREGRRYKGDEVRDFTTPGSGSGDCLRPRISSHGCYRRRTRSSDPCDQQHNRQAVARRTSCIDGARIGLH